MSIAPHHPGTILNEEYLKPLNVSPEKLAKSINVPIKRVNDLLNQKQGITADMALRLSLFFGTSYQFWVNLQAGYEWQLLRQETGETVASITQIIKRHSRL